MDLDDCRPAAVSADERARLLAELPREGEVTRLTKEERSRLAGLQTILSVHGRERVYSVKVMDMREAAAGLHGRAVLLVSQGALRLLEAEELQAVVAHEIGHEYVWEHYAAAVSRGDMARVRDLELACDAIAVLTLARARIDPKRLISAVEKVYRFNTLRFRRRDESRYPTLQQRRELIERIGGGR